MLENMHLNFLIYDQPAHPSMNFDVCGQSYILSSFQEHTTFFNKIKAERKVEGNGVHGLV